MMETLGAHGQQKQTYWDALDGIRPLRLSASTALARSLVSADGNGFHKPRP
jgi:hypothetical protein